MSTTKSLSASLLAAVVALSAPLSGTPANAAPLATVKSAVPDRQPTQVQDVRHRGWGGVGIYIGPSYGYYPRYGYYDDGYYDYPRYRYRQSYYYDDYRPHRKYSRRWTKDRFEHPLGRR